MSINIEPISMEDLKLINSLGSRTYSGNRLNSSASEEEIKQFNSIKNKLKQIAIYFQTKYDSEYGHLDYDVTSGNPIAIGGTRLNRVWSGIFKGASNKQYSTQISFVINKESPCLEVGFYFGRASAHSLNSIQRKDLENRLKFLGETLSKEISTKEEMTDKFD